MKRLISVTLGIALCASGASAQSSDSLLAPGRAGRVTIGMIVEDVYAAFGRENVKLIDLYSEGMFTPAVQIFVAPDRAVPIVVANIDQVCGRYRITGISALSPRFRTVDGLGVGSTVGEIRKRQPTAKPSREEGTWLIVENLQMTFGLPPASFADTTHVVSVWTWAPLPDSMRQCPR